MYISGNGRFGSDGSVFIFRRFRAIFEYISDIFINSVSDIFMNSVSDIFINSVSDIFINSVSGIFINSVPGIFMNSGGMEMTSGGPT